MGHELFRTVVFRRPGQRVATLTFRVTPAPCVGMDETAVREDADCFGWVAEP